jgi:putative FmdB family regulatory protein
MPTYEYRCESCGTVFELRQKFADEPLKVHESCGGPVHRILSAPALQFKGSGWYITDYGRGSGNKGSNGSKSESSDSEKSETKSETKIETKTETKTASTSTSTDAKKS